MKLEVRKEVIITLSDESKDLLFKELDNLMGELDLQQKHPVLWNIWDYLCKL